MLPAQICDAATDMLTVSLYLQVLASQKQMQAKYDQSKEASVSFCHHVIQPLSALTSVCIVFEQQSLFKLSLGPCWDCK